MANNRLQLEGLAELRAALRQLPAELTGDAASPVEQATDRTESALLQVYPVGDTGKLRAGVKKQITRGPVHVTGLVRSTSPHAHLWEFGTQVRATRQGWNRGKVPDVNNRDGLVSIAQRERRRMHGELVEIVRKAGFEVSGVL